MLRPPKISSKRLDRTQKIENLNNIPIRQIRPLKTIHPLQIDFQKVDPIQKI